MDRSSKASKPEAAKKGARPFKAPKRVKNEAAKKPKQPCSSSLLQAGRLAIDRTKDALIAGPKRESKAKSAAPVILTSQLLRELASKAKMAGQHAEAEKHERAARVLEIRGPRAVANPNCPPASQNKRS